MTNEKARIVIGNIPIKPEVLDDCYDITEYQEAKAMAIKALEKDIAKEPVQTHKRYGHGYEYDDYYCPECDEFLAYEPQGNGYKREGGWSRCKNCGQKIKWESESK